MTQETKTFNIGDRVRVVGYDDRLAQIGMVGIGTVTDIRYGNQYYVTDDSDKRTEYWWDASELERIV